MRNLRNSLSFVLYNNYKTGIHLYVLPNNAEYDFSYLVTNSIKSLKIFTGNEINH